MTRTAFREELGLCRTNPVLHRSDDADGQFRQFTFGTLPATAQSFAKLVTADAILHKKSDSSVARAKMSEIVEIFFTSIKIPSLEGISPKWN